MKDCHVLKIDTAKRSIRLDGNDLHGVQSCKINWSGCERPTVELHMDCHVEIEGSLLTEPTPLICEKCGFKLAESSGTHEFICPRCGALSFG